MRATSSTAATASTPWPRPRRGLHSPRRRGRPACRPTGGASAPAWAPPTTRPARRGARTFSLDPGVDLAAIDWADVQGAAHFYLFTLKALAYLRLRRGDLAEAGAVLDTLARLDPDDGVGAAVTRSLLQGAADAA